MIFERKEKDGLWPGAGAPSANFIARKPSLGGHVLTDRFRASNSKSWRARLGQELPLVNDRSYEA